MNYKNVSNKKKNTIVIVVALVLSLVLLAGTIAGLGFAFDWWGKSVPTSTYVLNVESIDEIIGVKFSTEDFTAYYDAKEMYKYENAETFDGTYPELLEKRSWASIILDVKDYGVDYKVVEPGLYNVAFKVNGKSYEAEEVEYFKASSDNWYSFEVENESLYFGITDMNALSHLTETDYEDGSSICLWSNGFVIESFELTKFEKVN